MRLSLSAKNGFNTISIELLASCCIVLYLVVVQIFTSIVFQILVLPEKYVTQEHFMHNIKGDVEKHYL